MTSDAITLTGPEMARAKPAALVWNDPFLMDSQLSEEERMIRDTAHGYCQDRLMSRVVLANRHETFDRDIMTEMGDLGTARRYSTGEIWRCRSQLCGLRSDCT